MKRIWIKNSSRFSRNFYNRSIKPLTPWSSFIPPIHHLSNVFLSFFTRLSFEAVFLFISEVSYHDVLVSSYLNNFVLCEQTRNVSHMFATSFLPVLFQELAFSLEWQVAAIFSSWNLLDFAQHSNEIKNRFVDHPKKH